MKKNRFLVIALLMLIHGVVFSQTQFYGKITDAFSNQSLSNVNIYIENTYVGTTSNSEGRFQLKVPKLPARLICSHIGYETMYILLNTQSQFQLNVIMNPTIIKLDAVEIYADNEDPAVRIMRQVISKNIEQKAALKSYQAKAYSRIIVGRDTSLLSLAESISTLYWDGKLGMREEFKAKKQGRQLPYLTDRSVGAEGILNFTDDNIELMNHTFAGPVHPNALDYYDFELADIKGMNSTPVFEIDVLPKSKLQPLFKGKIYVLDKSFAVIEVDLRNSGSFSFATMLKSFSGHYQQQYSNFGKDFWLPVDSRSEECFEVDMGMLIFPEATVQKISRISDYRVNVEVAAMISHIDTLKISSSDKASLLANHGAFEDFDGIPLTIKEYRLYSEPDTTLTLMKAYPPRGALSGYMRSKEKDMEAALLTHSDYNVVNPSSKFGYEGWYNRVEGLHLGIKVSKKFNRLNTSVTAGYQTARKKPFIKGSLNYDFAGGSLAPTLSLQYADQVVPRVRSQRYGQLLASLVPFVGIGDYFDYYHTKAARLNAQWKFNSIDTRIETFLASENAGSVSTESDWAIWKKSGGFRVNPAIYEGRINSAGIRFNYDSGMNGDPFERIVGGGRYNTLSLELEHSSDQLKSDFNYTRLTGSAECSVNTFYRRRPDPQYLRVRIEGSTFTGDLPLQRWMGIDGSMFGHTPFASFHTIRNRILEGEKKLALFWEYNFMTIPFEWLGLAWIAQQKFELAMHGAHGRTWIEAGTLDQINQQFNPFYKDAWHHEVGISMKFKYYFFGIRLDITRNLETNQHYLGFGLQMIGMSF
ncbi:carboxypeptidase-like regulatory domain-containing protein [bacterium]|nr:carboxypeptidase-like regulatory domain-containing protein [bacterium]